MSLELDLHPNDLSEQLTGRDYVSWSAISTYQSCPLKWYFRYVADLPEETVSSSLVFGGAIHRAAELHYRELLAGNPAPDLDTLLAEYQEAWLERDLDAIKLGKNETLDSLSQLAERVLSAFQASDIANPSGAIVGVEEELRGQLTKDSPDLLARVDLIIDDHNSLTLVDLKTARSRWSAQQVDSSADQLMLYSELAKELQPGKRLNLQFAVISKTKSPSVDIHTVPIYVQRVARTRKVVSQVWKSIQAGHVYPAPSPMICGGCPFKEPCHEWAAN